MKTSSVIVFLMGILLFSSAISASDGKDWFSQSEEAARRNDWSAAENHMRKALDLEPQNESYLLRMAEIKAKRSDFAGAAAILDALAGSAREPGLLQCKKAVITALSGDAAGAADLARRLAAEGVASECSPLTETAGALYSKGFFAEAMKLLSVTTADARLSSAMESARRRMSREIFEKGRRELAEVRRDEALSTWKMLLEADPLNPDLTDFVCEGAEERSFIDTLRGLLKESLKRNADLAPLASARTLRCIGEHAEARERLERAATDAGSGKEWELENAALDLESSPAPLDEILKKADPQKLNADDWLRLAQAAQRGRDGASAVRIIEEAFAAGANDRKLFIYMERIHSMNDDLPFKEDWLQTAERLFPDDAAMQIIIGQAYFMREMNERALPYFERAFAVAPHSSNLLGMIAAVYHDLEDKSAVSADLERRYKNDPKEPMVRMALGVISYYNGDYARAIELIEPLQKEFPQEARVWIYSMMSYFHLGKQAEAERLLEHAMNMNDADVHYCAGVIFEKSDPRRAVHEMDRFLSMSEYLPKRHMSKIARVKQSRDELQARIEGAGNAEAESALSNLQNWILNSLVILGIFLFVFIAGRRKRRK